MDFAAGRYSSNPAVQPGTPPSAAPEPQPAPVVAPAAPASAAFESVASTTPCKVSGKPRVVAPSAIVSAGVEVRAVGNDVALGFAPNEHQATAVRIDPSVPIAPNSDIASSRRPPRTALQHANIVEPQPNSRSTRQRRSVNIDPAL